MFLSQSAHLLSAGIIPLTCLCSTLPVSHTSSSDQLPTPVSASLYLLATPPHQANSPHLWQPRLHLSLLLSLLQCQIVLVLCLTFQRFSPGLITCCRPRLSPTCLPRLCPGYYLSLLSWTTRFAYSLLVTHLLGSVATQLTTGPVCQLGNPPVVGFSFSQRHQAHSFSDLAEDHCEPRLFTLPLYKLLKTAVINKDHYRLISRLPVLLLGPHHTRDSFVPQAT